MTSLRAVSALTVGVMAAAFILMLVPTYQALVDLPSHLQHFHYSLGGGTTGPNAQFIDYRWRLLPTLGTEIIVYLLGPALGLALATKLTVALIPAINAGGILVLARVVHGRITPLHLAALPLAFSYPFAYGFLDYCFASGLALWAGAGWIALERRGAARSLVIFGLLIAPLLMVSHLGGWMLFGVIAFGGSLAERRRGGWIRAGWSSVVSCLPIAWPVPILILLRSGAGGQLDGWLDLHQIAAWGASALREENLVIDLASGAALYLLCLLPIVLRRRFRYDLTLFIPAVIVWLAVLFVPLVVFASVFANVRLVPYALILTILTLKPTLPLPGWLWLVSGTFVAFRFLVTLVALLHASARIDTQLGALPHIPVNARFVTFVLEPCGFQWAPRRSRSIHLYAAIERNALSSSNFTVPGQHLLRVTYPPAQDLMVSGSNIVTDWKCQGRRMLEEAYPMARAPAFDYLWLFDVPAGRLPRQPNFRPVWQAEGSALYRIVGATDTRE